MYQNIDVPTEIFWYSNHCMLYPAADRGWANVLPTFFRGERGFISEQRLDTEPIQRPY